MALENYGAGSGGCSGRGEMVWKEEVMYRWRSQIDATMIDTTQDVNFEFKQSIETGGEQFSWTARYLFELKTIAPGKKGFVIGFRLKALNSEGAGSKLLPAERLSLIVERAFLKADSDNLSPPVCIGDCYVWPMPVIKMTEKKLNEFQMHGGSMIVTFILKTKISTKIIWPSEIVVMKKFYKMITKLENDEKKSDLKIISSDGKEFFAYRWILAEVSDVFEAMFRSHMKEKESGVLKMDDLSGTTVKTLLHFIYSGEVANEWSSGGTAEELMYAADKYQIGELKNFLDANVGMICTAENAGALLAMAEKTSLKKAVADILAFIREQCKDPKGFFEIVKHIKTE